MLLPTLKIGEESYKLLQFEYSFDRGTNAMNYRPIGSIQGGDIILQLDSSGYDTTSIAEMFRHWEPVFCKIEVLNVVTMTPHRTIELEEAYITDYKELMDAHASTPLILTISLTPVRFNIANTFCIDRGTTTGIWRKYIPEGTSSYRSAYENQEQIKECTVYFRRTKDYDGSFGFDWLRTGDTDEVGCGWYKDIMPSVADYDKLAAYEYMHFTQDWRLQYGKYKSTATYLIPWVTLMEGHTAKFRVKLCVNEPSGKLRFKVTGRDSQMLSLSYDTAEANTLGEYYIKDLEVRCIGPFSSVTYIEVHAGQDLVGKMIFLPNHKIYPLDVAVVTVKTREFHSRKLCVRKPEDEVLQGVATLLGQAYIIPNFVHYELDTNEVADIRDASSGDRKKKDVYFKDNYGRNEIVRTSSEYDGASLLDIFFKNNNEKRVKTNSDGGKTYFLSFHNFLNKMLYEQRYEKDSKDMFKLYFINEEAAGDNKSGEARSKEKTAVIFKNGYNIVTIAHELLHCLSLSHTFLDSMDNDKDKIYIFKKYFTDNIMDYEKDGDSANKRISLWYWQMKQLWKNLE